MELRKIYKEFKRLDRYTSFESLLLNNKNPRAFIKGLTGSSLALFCSATINAIKGTHFFALEDKDSAAYFYNDMKHCLGERNILFFPSSYKRSVQYKQADNGSIILRTKVLDRISKRNKAKSPNLPLVVISYPEALTEKVVTQDEIAEHTLQLHAGEQISIEFIHEVLDEYGFELVDFVYEPGQYALRGSIVDIFSFTDPHPFRIDFFGDEVESLRSFDAESQLSVSKFESITILPNLETDKNAKSRQVVLNLLQEDAYYWCSSIDIIADRISQLYDSTNLGDDVEDKNQYLLMGSEFTETISKKKLIEFGMKPYYPNSTNFEFKSKPQPSFNKNFNLLGDNLKMHLAQGFKTIILSENEKQIERLRHIFEETHQGIEFEASVPSIHQGFIIDELQLCCYTDHQIFDRYHKYQIHSFQSSKASLSLRELKDLKPGDYVVHSDHGIGRFGGLEKIEVNKKIQEAIKLVYRDNDVLFVSIHSLHRISKYKGKDDAPPKIYKLGTGAWQKLKQNTKKKVKDIAKDLIALYAKRKSQEGFKYSGDSYLQEELEASFIYEDTPDQLKATKAVKSDMESKVPMDRLICGDVGFGKTEVAVRAAFKAVADNKQVAVLVPTTILALQHFKTFQSRMKEFPCTIDYISRLRKPAQQKATLKNLEEGKVDILIGTHRLLGKDIKYKDLGLLIIDEEQKFGVAAKEKLKSLKLNVDTLTMTATPIPRTLQFSLMGARDLSIINTSPPNRHPIVTELHSFNHEIIAEGINFETSRGGQVFFIHNRVQNIYEVEALINKLCPNVKTIVGHGQMDGPKLEKIMIDYMSGDYDVLIATTIIESGLDIPNANTIFINNANYFGLSDLHQLRGRVGRSNKKAFCYLLAPPLTSVTPEARRRLKAIEEFSDLGSGFHIALQDLDIRGAGNMLGGEQSGFITDIGFETYNRILDEAMQELKENEFKDLFAEETIPEEDNKDKCFVGDCTIDTDFEIHIPDNYVENIAERIRLYRELDNIEGRERLEEFRLELIDRFGNLPVPTQELFRIVQLRWDAMKIGFERIILKSNKLIAYFVSNQESPYYQSGSFRLVLDFIQKHPRQVAMKEGKNKLSLVVENIASLESVQILFNKILQKDELSN